jgi:phenylpyruvate tautomerase PptA (4-oxalocrotonate tautomerase family)
VWCECVTMSGDARVRSLVYYKTEACLRKGTGQQPTAYLHLTATLGLRKSDRKGNAMPMIDIYAVAGTFADTKQLAIDAANTVKTIEGVPDIPMFRQNTAAFVHELPVGTLANVDGDENYVRVQVLTNEGALDREKQLAVVAQLTQLVSTAAGDATLKERTWVLLTEAKEGGWGLWGHAHTNEELVAAARDEITKLRSASSEQGRSNKQESSNSPT